MKLIRKSSTTLRRRFFGGALIEAALVLPVLFYLVLGAMQFGYYFYVKNTLQGAAREGCRAGIVLNNSNTDVTTSVAQYLKAAGLNSSATTLDPKYTLLIESPQGTSANAGSMSAGTALYVTIQASWSNVGIMMLPSQLGGLTPGKAVKGISVMRKEG